MAEKSDKRIATYLGKAEAARQRAKRAIDEAIRENWAGLAKAWESLAVLSTKDPHQRQL